MTKINCSEHSQKQNQSYIKKVPWKLATEFLNKVTFEHLFYSVGARQLQKPMMMENADWLKTADHSYFQLTEWAVKSFLLMFPR